MTEPAGAIDGDLLVACIAYRGTAAFTAPSGWTLVAQETNDLIIPPDPGIGDGAMWYQVRSGTPNLTFTRTNGDVAMGRIVAYKNARAVGAALDTFSAETDSANGNPQAPTLTTAEDGELLVMMIAMGDNSAGSAYGAATDPTSASQIWHERGDSSTTTGGDTGLAIADATKWKAGATGGFTATVSGSDRHVMIVGAFKGAPTGFSAKLETSGSDTLSAGIQFTFPSITPPANALLLMVGSFAQDTINLEDAITSVTGGGLTWTRLLEIGSTVSGDPLQCTYTDVWSAQCGASPGTVTVIVNFTDPVPNYDAFSGHVHSITGHLQSSPFGVQITGTGVDGTTGALTLPSAPANSSLVFAGRTLSTFSAGTMTATPGLDFCEFADTAVATWMGLESQISNFKTDTAINWIDINDTNQSNGGILPHAFAFEIKSDIRQSLLFKPVPLQPFLVR